MNMYVCRWLSVVALFSTFAACQNQEMPASPQFRIRKVVKMSAQESSTDTYSYNSQGRLDTIYKAYTDRRKTSNRDYYYRTVFRYDGQGKLTTIEYQPDYTAPGTIIPSRYDYTYDASGNAVVIKYTQTSSDPVGNQFSKTTFNLVYSGGRFPVKITAVSDAFLDETVTEYTYAQENVVSLKKASGTRTYSFDDKPNPFYGLYIGMPDPDIFSDYAFKLNTFYQSNTFSRNNCLYPNLTYAYDSNGNLVRISGNPTTTFEYEQY